MRSSFVFEGIKEKLFCLINHNVYFCNKCLHISYKTVHLKLRNTAYKCENINTTLFALSTWSTICFSPVFMAANCRIDCSQWKVLSALTGFHQSVWGIYWLTGFPSAQTHTLRPLHTPVSNKAQKGPGLNSAFYLLITASRLRHNLQKTWGTL